MRLSKIPVATSTAGRPEGLSVFELSTDIFGRMGVPACRRISVHAPDIKEEYKEFKEYWRGAALKRVSTNGNLCSPVERGRKPSTSRRLPETTHGDALRLNSARGL